MARIAKKRNTAPTLVLGANGKTGRRVVQRLQRLGLPVRAVSPSAAVRFDWNDASTWEAALDGAENLYLTYFPDLAVPSAAPHIRALSHFAVDHGGKQSRAELRDTLRRCCGRCECCNQQSDEQHAPGSFLGRGHSFPFPAFSAGGRGPAWCRARRGNR